VTPLEFRAVCRDPDDDSFLSVAVAAQVDYLISGDQDLRVLGDIQGTPILSPTEFLHRMADG